MQADIGCQTLFQELHKCTLLLNLVKENVLINLYLNFQGVQGSFTFDNKLIMRFTTFNLKENFFNE